MSTHSFFSFPHSCFVTMALVSPLHQNLMDSMSEESGRTRSARRIQKRGGRLRARGREPFSRWIMYHTVVLVDHAVAQYYAVVSAGGCTADQRSRCGIVSCLTVVPEEPSADHVVYYQKVALEERAVHNRRYQRTENIERTTATNASGGKTPTRTGWTVRAQSLSIGSNTCEEKTKAGEHAK